MIDNLLKELEKIKDLKSKKEFLAKALKLYSDKKTQEKIKEILIQLEKIEQEKKNKSKEEPINIQEPVNTRNIAPSTLIEIEEAPKYEPQNARNNAEERPRAFDFANPQERQPAGSGLERLTNEDSNSRTERTSAQDDENLSEYVSRVSGVVDRERELRLQRIYRTPEQLRRNLEHSEIEQRTDKYLRPSGHDELNEYLPMSREQEELKRWTQDIPLNPKFTAKIDQKYSVDVVENLKKQKKQLEDKYL